MPYYTDMGRHKKLRNEEELLDYIEHNPKSIAWQDFQWLLKVQGWKKISGRRRGADWAYKNDLLSAFAGDEERRAGRRTPVGIICFGVPHGGKDTMNPSDLRRLLPILRDVAELRKEAEDGGDKEDT